MTRTCPSCGIAIAPETRFCRRCGTPLRASTSDDGSDSVSPIAKTIPLSEEGRATDGLAPEDARRSETGRVNRAELDAMLRPTSARPSQNFDPLATIPHVDSSALRDEQPSQPSTSGGFDGNSTVAYPTDAQGRPILPGGAETRGGQLEDEGDDLTVTVSRPELPASRPDAFAADNFVVPPMSQVSPQQPPSSPQ